MPPLKNVETVWVTTVCNYPKNKLTQSKSKTQEQEVCMVSSIVFSWSWAVV